MQQARNHGMSDASGVRTLSGEQLLVLAVLGGSAARFRVDRELDRRACVPASRIPQARPRSRRLAA